MEEYDDEGRLVKMEKKGYQRCGRKVSLKNQTKLYFLLLERGINASDLHRMIVEESPRTACSLSYIQDLVAGRKNDAKMSAYLQICSVLGVELDDVVDKEKIKIN